MYESTNIRIDITKTVTEVKVVFSVFVIPLKSNSPFRLLAQPKARHMLVRGSIKAKRKLSTIFINSSIEPFETIAAEILPPIVNIARIIGTNAPIMLQSSFMYSPAFVTKPLQMLNTVIEIHRLEQREKTSPTPVSDNDALRVLNTEIKIISTRTEEKLFNT